ncbi:MAG: CvpA family protein [Bacilli bacterium]|nr:CvpA family protein [Bacilli bacterium]
MINTLYDVSSFLPTSNQSIFFDWISIVYIVILLLALIIGIKKGFIKMILSLFGVILCFVAAYFLAEPLATWAKNSFTWDQGLTDSIYSWFLSKSSAASQVLNRTDAEIAMPALMNAIGVPGVFQSYVSSFALSSIPVTGASLAVGIYIASGLTNIAFSVGAFIAIFIVAVIILSIIQHITKKIMKNTFIGSVDKLLGAIIGLCIGAIFIVVISYGLTFVTAIGGAGQYISDTLRLNDDSFWSFGKMIYENNFFSFITDQIAAL